MKSKVLAIFAVVVLAGCSSVPDKYPMGYNIRPVDDQNLLDLVSLHEVCIVRNSKVTISDFISVLQDGFSRHNIATSVVEPARAKSCEVTLTYAAMRGWDFKPYISHVELRLWRGGKQIGSADYSNCCTSLSKWGTTKEKMDPIIDQLLSGKASN